MTQVKDNIEQFGGDPGRITLGGQEVLSSAVFSQNETTFFDILFTHFVLVSVISNLILFDTICQFNQIPNSNCEAAMLSNSIVKGSISYFHNPHP